MFRLKPPCQRGYPLDPHLKPRPSSFPFFMDEIQCTTIRITHHVEIILKKAHRSAYMSAYMKNYRQDYSGKRINATFSPKEHAHVQKVADRHGKTPTAFVREATLAQIHKNPLIPEDLKAQNREISILLRRIGHSFNQIAKHANAVQKVTFPEWARVLSVIAKLDRHLTKRVESSIQK